MLELRVYKQVLLILEVKSPKHAICILAVHILICGINSACRCSFFLVIQSVADVWAARRLKHAKEVRSCDSGHFKMLHNFLSRQQNPGLRVTFICFSICDMLSLKHITCWFKVGPDTHAVINRATAAHAAHLDPNVYSKTSWNSLVVCGGKGSI